MDSWYLNQIVLLDIVATFCDIPSQLEVIHVSSSFLTKCEYRYPRMVSPDMVKEAEQDDQVAPLIVEYKDLSSSYRKQHGTLKLARASCLKAVRALWQLTI